MKPRVSNYHEDSDHEYLSPRPVGPVGPVSQYSHDDIDKVMKQISLAVAKSRGVSSLSRAVSKNNKSADGYYTLDRPNKDKYPYKVCSASLPRPKLKRLNDKPRAAKYKETNYNNDKDRLFGVLEEPENDVIGDGRDHVTGCYGPGLMGTRSHLDMTLAHNNYYNLYAPHRPGE